MKYSQARAVVVDVTISSNELAVSISDDGQDGATHSVPDSQACPPGSEALTAHSTLNRQQVVGHGRDRPALYTLSGPFRRMEWVCCYLATVSGTVGPRP